MTENDRRRLRARTAHLPVFERWTELELAISRADYGLLTDYEMQVSNEMRARLPDAVRWFHGGTAGLAPGDELLPAAETGRDPRGLGATIRHRQDAVYITDSFLMAQCYALAAGGGVVYEVAPDGAIHVDPVHLRCLMTIEQGWPPHAFCCASATIVRTVPGNAWITARARAILDRDMRIARGYTAA